ncbi:reduced lateral root formation, partial [Prunus dulcis]
TEASFEESTFFFNEGCDIKRRTSWTDLNPGRRFEACDQNRIAKQDIISLNGWIMKHVQEERKCFLDCLEDSEVWRKKLEQEMSN